MLELSAEISLIFAAGVRQLQRDKRRTFKPGEDFVRTRKYKSVVKRYEKRHFREKTRKTGHILVGTQDLWWLAVGYMMHTDAVAVDYNNSSLNNNKPPKRVSISSVVYPSTSHGLPYYY